MTEFMKLTPAARARRIEATRLHIYRMKRENGRPLREDKRLSITTVTWLQRLMAALVDETCTDATYAEMDRAAAAAIPVEEHDEFRRRLLRFVVLRDIYPPDSTSSRQAVRPIMETLKRRIEAGV